MMANSLSLIRLQYSEIRSAIMLDDSVIMVFE